MGKALKITKIISVLIFMLLSVVLFPTTAFSAYDYTVDALACTAELRLDGSVVVTQEWTVTFSGESDGFSRRVNVPEDNFETFSSLTEVTVSADGTVCGLSDETKKDNTYTFTKEENSYNVQWHKRSQGGTAVFALRYVLGGAVKLYDDSAYFYLGIVGADENLVCRNVTVNVKTQGACPAENFEILHSGSLAGKKTNSNIEFFADNASGEMKIGLKMPLSAFKSESLPVIVRDNTVLNVFLCLLAVILCVLAAYVIYYSFNRKAIIIKKWEKRCRKRALDESSYRKQSAILKKIGAADILYSVAETTASEADLFIVNLLELVKRGYVTVDGDGFSSTRKSEFDDIGRPLSKSDKIVIDAFDEKNYRKTLENKELFYRIVERHSKTVKLGLLFEFTKDGRKILDRCFEMSLSAKRHEYVSPSAVSDDFFKNGKYTVIDLIIAVLNEKRLLQNKDYKVEGTSKYICDLFSLRKAYDGGKDAFLLSEAKRKEQKNAKRQKTESYDD